MDANSKSEKSKKINVTVLEFQAKETKTSTLVNNGKISKKMYSASIMDALYNVTVLGP
jgi:hypothetical protein